MTFFRYAFIKEKEVKNPWKEISKNKTKQKN